MKNSIGLMNSFLENIKYKPDGDGEFPGGPLWDSGLYFTRLQPWNYSLEGTYGRGFVGAL